MKGNCYIFYYFSVSDLHLAPIGTITAWVTKPVEDAESEELPDGWVRCDGSTIPHPSIWAGKMTPELNKGRFFLRGSEDKDMLTLEDDQLQDHMHEDSGHSHVARSTASPHSHSYKDDYYYSTKEVDLIAYNSAKFDIGDNSEKVGTTDSETVTVYEARTISNA